MTPLASAVEVAGRVLGELGARGVVLAPLTTYRVGGPAALLVRPTTVDDLVKVYEAVHESGLPVLVVGRGSNLLIADEGFAGIAIVLGSSWADIIIDPVTRRVVAGAAASLPVLARRTVAASLSGLEWAVGVPGSVGGGVRMNAGGHGSDIAASLLTIDLFDLHRGSAVTLPASGLGLRFRGSDLAEHQLVLSAAMQLQVGEQSRSEVELEEIVRWRREHQPGGQNAGSVFVNPVPGEVAAGALIDALGLRGFRIGSAHVSLKHANFIQADEGARARDVLDVIIAVRTQVAEATGHQLRSEVRLIGFPEIDVEVQAGVKW
ncbi:MAG: UDP-N-acetylmuramate dehydrogenase [Actinomycetota bacterium]|nr:MAG: murB [Acidimicrobiaceae bacterium]